jgi:hypothetical protein
MRIIALAAAAATFASASLAPAGAQTYGNAAVTASARNIYAACAQMSQRSGMGDVRAACACITGYMGGTLSDRDYEVAAILLRVGQMTENGASQDAIDSEIIAFFQRGFTETDVNRVAAAVDQMSARGDAICGQFEQRGSV